MTENEIVHSLQNAGYRITKVRARLAHVIGLCRERPFSAETLLRQMEDHPEDHCDRASVYRNLHILEEVGVLRTCGVFDETRFYDFQPTIEESVYIVCRRCHRIQKFSEKPFLPTPQALAESGFHAIQASLHFSGICQSCAQTS